MKTVTITELRRDIYNLLDEVLETGMPLEVNRGGKVLRVIAKEPVDRFANLVERPMALVGDPDDLVHIEWAYALDLP